MQRQASLRLHQLNNHLGYKVNLEHQRSFLFQGRMQRNLRHNFLHTSLSPPSPFTNCANCVEIGTFGARMFYSVTLHQLASHLLVLAASYI